MAAPAAGMDADLNGCTRTDRQGGDTSRPKHRPPSTTQHHSAQCDTTRHDEPDENSTSKRIKELEDEVDNLRLDARVNRGLANFMKEQNKDLIKQMGDDRQLIGSLKTELKALLPPQEASESVDARCRVTTRRVGRIVLL